MFAMVIVDGTSIGRHITQKGDDSVERGPAGPSKLLQSSAACVRSAWKNGWMDGWRVKKGTYTYWYEQNGEGTSPP